MMEISNSLASMSMMMSKAQASQAINFKTLKLAMDAESANMEALSELIQAAAPQGVVDIQA